MRQLSLLSMVAVVACKPAPTVVTTDESSVTPMIVAPELDTPGTPTLDRDLFPLVDGARYTYLGVFEGKRYEPTLTIREHMVGGAPAYYWLSDIDTVEPDGWFPLVGLPPEPGAQQLIPAYDGDKSLVVTVVGPAEVTVAAGTFDCVELKIEERWPQSTSEGRVWLAPGVGVVRWLRTTGRVDELVSYELDPG